MDETSDRAKRKWARRVRRLRERLGLTQREFAVKVGNLEPASVSRWERAVFMPGLEHRQAIRRLERQSEAA